MSAKYQVKWANCRQLSLIRFIFGVWNGGVTCTSLEVDEDIAQTVVRRIRKNEERRIIRTTQPYQNQYLPTGYK